MTAIQSQSKNKTKDIINMFQLLLDTADVKKIAEINEYLPVHGVTTNPSIMAGSGKGDSCITSDC
ncbi:MAG: hypothetical protein H0A75_03710 [Candidatus Methanofishera endochildressiae]|uniref:Transaldolase n=1 Tax=Candidatus Methanofishera endochildressiae TaxID=2738884 RepID=A0A7Z0MNF1_9GAMM|nr:hypothetical protein [Candidatus Methanofishera endochildressiae]